MQPRPWRTLVDARSLRSALGDPDLVLLDCRHALTDPDAGPRAYAEGHLPGAAHAHVDRDLSGPVTPATGRHPLPDPDTFRATCSRWGIGPGVQVVAYDDKGGAWAARAWWLLRHYGHRDVAVLDGGLQAWTALGGRLTTEPPHRQPRRFTGAPGHLPTVEAGDILQGKPRIVVDVRDPARYRGEQEPVDRVAGHIPGAVNAPFSGNLDAAGRFLAPGALRERYEGLLGGAGAEGIALYCGSGVTAAHGLLALEHAGLPGAALYPGSWSEWIRDAGRPVARGAEPGGNAL